MQTFDSWLKGRDIDLSEALSAETIEKHGHDALAYARSKVEERVAAERKAEMRSALGAIQSELEAWVSSDSNNAERLKAIAAVLNSHLADKHSDSLVATIATNLPDVDSLDGLSKTFSKSSLDRAMSDHLVLRDLSKLLSLDYVHDISHAVAKRQPEHHGEVGRHFADFAVSQMLHASADLLKQLNQAPTKVDEPTFPDAAKNSSQTAPSMGSQE